MMASSILNSDDGVISGTAGLKSVGGDDGVLVFQSKGTETARINTDKQIVAAAGTASLPIYSTTGDTNTGIFFPAADTIAFAEGGAEAMRIDSSGSVLVGTTTATNNIRLQANMALVRTGSGNYGGLLLSNYGGTSAGVAPFMDFNRSRGTTDGSMTAVADGDTLGYLVFRGSNGSVFATTSQIESQVDGSLGAGVPGRLLFSTTTSGGTLAERARITSGGFFKASNSGTYVNSTGSYHEIYSTVNNNNIIAFYHGGTSGQQYGPFIKTANDQNDTTRYFLQCDGGGVERATFRSNGGLANYSANNVNLASDERLKKDISPLASTWSKVKDIEVVNFRYKDCNEGDPALYGVIAQQVQPIVPELVVVTREAQEAVEAKEAVLDDDGNVVEPAIEAKEATPEYFGIREQPMYWLAIKALQEAMERIETLEAKVSALEANNGA